MKANKFYKLLIMLMALSLNSEVSAKVLGAVNQELAANIEKEIKEIGVEKSNNMPPKEAAAKMLETIDQIYVRVPPGYMGKEPQETLWFLKGQAYTTLEMFEEGIKAFEEVIKINPKNLNSYGNISYIMNLQGKYEQSIKLSDWVISKNYFFINAHTNKGYSLFGLGRYQEAVDQFEKARQINPDDMSVYLGYARGYGGMKEHKKAIEIYDSLIKYIRDKSEDSPQLKILASLRGEQQKLLDQEKTRESLKIKMEK